MDPFVVTTLGRNTYRTRVIRHNLNPVYDEKLVFQVMKHEVNYSLGFSVVDRDKFSGNDYVGSVNLPLLKAVEAAPEADPETGLYDLPDIPDGTSPPATEEKRRRFRIPLSRTSSSQSLSKQISKPSLPREGSSNSLNPNLLPDDAPIPQQNLQAPTSTPSTGLSQAEVLPAVVPDDDPDLKPYVLALDLKNKERWESKHNPTLYVRVKYLPYRALRQQFWRAMLKQYDADESGHIDKVELTTMLDTLGSTLHESTIDGWFERFNKTLNGDVPYLTFDEAVLCIEDQLQKGDRKNSNSLRPPLSTANSSLTLNSNSGSPNASTPALTESGYNTPLNAKSQSTLIPAIQAPELGLDGEEGGALDEKDLADEQGEEHVIEIRECPICHQPRLKKKSDADIITHVATCASQDWRQVNSIVMAGFVTSAQAQRKWYSKVITKIGYGGYKLGANSANILVQDRLTGQINEERMSVYVRLGIRLLYKGLKANNMEKKRSKCSMVQKPYIR
jgi:phosphatidylserine decarboxylase